MAVGGAVLENLVKIDDRTYTYRLTNSKTDQAGAEFNPDADKTLVGSAAEALTVWLQAACITSGAMFRRIRGEQSRGGPVGAGRVVDRQTARGAGWIGR